MYFDLLLIGLSHLLDSNISEQFNLRNLMTTGEGERWDGHVKSFGNHSTGVVCVCGNFIDKTSVNPYRNFTTSYYVLRFSSAFVINNNEGETLLSK